MSVEYLGPLEVEYLGPLEASKASMAGQFAQNAMEIPRALGETAATVVTGIPAWAISRTAGIVAQVLTGDKGFADEYENDIARSIGFDPNDPKIAPYTTSLGKHLTQKIGEAIGVVFGPIEEMSRLPEESWKSPLLGKVLRFGGEASLPKAGKKIVPEIREVARTVQDVVVKAKEKNIPLRQAEAIKNDPLAKKPVEYIAPLEETAKVEYVGPLEESKVIEPLKAPEIVQPGETSGGKQPWEMDKAAVRAGLSDELIYRPDSLSSGTLAFRDFDSGKTIVGDKYFELDIDGRKSLLIHEVGHDISKAILADKTQPWIDLMEPLRVQDGTPRSVRSQWKNPVGGSTKPEEILADIYGDIKENGMPNFAEGWSKETAAKLGPIYERVAKEMKPISSSPLPEVAASGGKQPGEMTKEELKAKYPTIPQDVVDKLGTIIIDPRHAGEGKFIPGKGLNIKGNDQSLLHEIGHVVDNILKPEQAAQWENISRLELKNGILGNKPDKLATDSYSIWENLYSAFSIYHRALAGEKLLPSEVSSLKRYPQTYQFVKENLSEPVPPLRPEGLPGTEGAVSGGIPKIRTDLLPSEWKMEVGKTRTKEGRTYEADVDWQGKRLVFANRDHIGNPDIVNHEIAHVVIEELPKKDILFSDYVALKTNEWKAKGYEPEWIAKNQFHREEIAMDYGNYLNDPNSVSPELKDLFTKHILSKGKPVPPSVLKDYPELAKKDMTPTASLIPEVKGGATGELPKYAEGSAINLERLNTAEDVKRFINNRAKEAEDAIGKQAKTWNEIEAESIALGWDTKAIKKEWTRKGSFTAAEINATRQTNLNSIETLHEAIKGLPYDQTTLTPELRAQFLDAMDLIKVTSQAASEAGRSLNIHKRILEKDPSFTDASQMAKILRLIEGKGGKRTDKMIIAMRDLDFADPKAINQFIYDYTKTKWETLSDKALELWMNGLLSHPLTHVVNTTSNALTLVYTYPERMLAAGIEAGRAAITGTKRGIFLGETAQDIFSVSKGIQDGLSRFSNAMKKGDMAGKLDYRPGAFPESVEKILPTRALLAEDAFFKGFIENAELNRMAYRQAASEGLKGQAFQDKVTDLLAHPTEAMLEEVAKRGQYLTYQKELGEIGKLVFKVRNTVPGLKYFIPFVKTPINIAKFALERTPLNLPFLAAKAIKGELKGAALS